jgi:ketosteroid isomerase-like protein
MSEENVEIVRRFAEAFQHGDTEMAFEFYDAEIELDQSQNTQLPPDLLGVYRGHAGIRDFWRRWLSAWRGLEFEIDGIRAKGDHVVLLIGNQRQWGRQSGALTEFAAYGIVFTFRNGLVLRMHSYPTQKAALDAAGLSE